MNKNVLIGVLVILLGLSLYFWKESINSHKELQSLNEVLTDSLQITKNEKGELVATISAFETQRAKDFIRFKTTDSLTLELQKEVKEFSKYLKRNGGVTKFSTDTKVDTTVPTEVREVSGEYPTYNSKFNLDNWVFGDVSAAKDSTRISLKVKNDYTVGFGREATGFLGLGKGRPFARVVNKNPYSETKTVISYSVSVPKIKRWGVGPFIGVDIASAPRFGLAVSYDLIQF